MEFWQAVSMVDINELPAIAQGAEEFGFEGIILSDHLMTFARQADFYEGSEDGKVIWDVEAHWPDPWVQIGALSQLTKTLKFLTGVYILPLRDPFSAAKAISTAAVLSSNRISLGIGIGWQKAEFKVVGQDFCNRGARTDEILEIFRKLIEGKVCDHHGKYYDFDFLSMSPGVEKEIPIYIGGTSDAALKRAVKSDGWIGAEHDVEELKLITQSLIREKALVARSEGIPFDIVACIKNYDGHKFEVARSLGVTKIYRNPWLSMTRKISLDKKLQDMWSFSKKYIGMI